MLCKIFKSKNGYINYEKIGGEVLLLEESVNSFISQNNITIEKILQSQSSSGDIKSHDIYLTISIFYNLK